MSKQNNHIYIPSQGWLLWSYLKYLLIVKLYKEDQLRNKNISFAKLINLWYKNQKN